LAPTYQELQVERSEPPATSGIEGSAAERLIAEGGLPVPGDDALG
jgi:hypothetical protein